MIQLFCSIRNNILLLFLRLQTSENKTILIHMSYTLLHMSSLFYVKETLPGCPYLSFIMTTDNQSITRMIWLPLQIKNHNCLVEAMPSIVLSPDPKCRKTEILFSRSWIWKMDTTYWKQRSLSLRAPSI